MGFPAAARDIIDAFVRASPGSEDRTGMPAAFFPDASLEGLFSHVSNPY
jgi:hypothetical protein